MARERQVNKPLQTALSSREWLVQQRSSVRVWVLPGTQKASLRKWHSS